MSVKVAIGGELREFKNTGEALQAQQEYVKALEARVAAAESAAQGGAAREFAITMARYSTADKYNTPAPLKGALKGEVKIVSAAIPFGVTMLPKTWFDLLNHQEEITKFIEENRKTLADAEQFAKDTKAKLKSGKA